MSTTGRYIAADGRHWWLEPQRVQGTETWTCAVYALPCWPVSCHPTLAGYIEAYSARRPSAELALAAAEVLVREMAALAAVSA